MKSLDSEWLVHGVHRSCTRILFPYFRREEFLTILAPVFRVIDHAPCENRSVEYQIYQASEL